MPLPDLVEIMPLAAPLTAEITVPGSKSITNRAMILAALADGVTTLEGALWSEDTQVMADALHELGFTLNVEQDSQEACNRRITIQGAGGRIPRAGTAEQPLELFVGNAGTAARFLAALVCLGDGVYRLSGVSRMHERPQADLFFALRKLGYRVDSPNDKLPALIWGKPPEGAPRACRVSIEQSSQFASALLLCARVGGWRIEVFGENADESPYVAMTTKMIEAFPPHGGRFQIEPDASSGSYFLGAAWLSRALLGGPDEPHHGPWRITVRNWPASDWQIDTQYGRGPELPIRLSRKTDLGDSIMTAIVLAPLATAPMFFEDLGRLRLQECERVHALRTELTKCGANIMERGDTLEVYPSPLHGAEIETYQDHRMAMCFAILGLKVPGIKIQNPACVRKTFPNFFQKLATPPPAGLGVEIRDGHTARRLAVEDLFAG